MKFISPRGFSIVEIVIAAAIIAISVVGIVGAVQIYLKIVYQNTREAQAVSLLDETAEALLYLRDVSYEDNFSNATAGTEYTVYWNGSSYQLATSTIALPYDMTRTIEIEDVNRDAADQIVASGGTEDQNTKKATITIEWPYKGTTTSISAEMLIHNMYEN